MRYLPLIAILVACTPEGSRDDGDDDGGNDRGDEDPGLPRDGPQQRRPEVLPPGQPEHAERGNRRAEAERERPDHVPPASGHLRIEIGHHAVERRLVDRLVTAQELEHHRVDELHAPAAVIGHPPRRRLVHRSPMI